MASKTLRFERKNLIVNGRKVKRLQRILKVNSASEAVRLAVERTIDAEEAIAALKRLQERGTWGQRLNG